MSSISGFRQDTIIVANGHLHTQLECPLRPDTDSNAVLSSIAAILSPFLQPRPTGYSRRAVTNQHDLAVQQRSRPIPAARPSSSSPCPSSRTVSTPSPPTASAARRAPPSRSAERRPRCRRRRHHRGDATRHAQRHVERERHRDAEGDRDGRSHGYPDTGPMRLPRPPLPRPHPHRQRHPGRRRQRRLVQPPRPPPPS